MSLPNYTPSGKILFGSVPWGDGYSNVRLYSSLDEQYNDIASMMTLSSDGYVYIGRNRRLKVDIEADRLYHCNYCMYRNESLTDGFIYCFVSDVEYINDNTSEVTLTTDIFQTYLYGVDWTVPPCFIERETVASESEAYLLTPEPDFPLVYTITAENHFWFNKGGYVVFTSATPQQNGNLAEDIINPSGWYVKPAPVHVYKGIPNGCNIYYCPVDTTSGHSEELELLLNGLTFAGSTDSVAAIVSLPSFALSGLKKGINESDELIPQDGHTTPVAQIGIPERGSSVDGYTPHNRKLLYYPYTYCNLTDYNGSVSELRYELRSGTESQWVADIKSCVSTACEAFVYPTNYMGVSKCFSAGIVCKCGALGSWNNNAFANWMGQNGGRIALEAGSMLLAGAGGMSSVGKAASALSRRDALTGIAGSHNTVHASASAKASARRERANLASSASDDIRNGMMQLGFAGGAAGGLYSEVTNAMHQPTTARGEVESNVMFGTGVQGVHSQRVNVVASVAKQIDQFFDRFGYAVERIEAVNITSRPSWNYVKTQSAVAKSSNVAAGSTAPFTRGRGTPADALEVIGSALDSGVTFWHTTSGFGDFSQDNSL